MTSTLTSKGQVTIPKAIRDQLEFLVQADGTLQVIPLTSLLKDLKVSCRSRPSRSASRRWTRP